MEPNQGIRTWQWVVTVIVIIILIVLGYYLFKGNKDTTGANNNNVPTTTNTVADANEINRIVVADQYPGNVVYISSAQIAGNGAWLEIHKDNAGQPGAIIGSTWVEKGIAPAKVTLTEKTLDGQLYYAMIHSDDGDKKYDGSKDLPMKDSRGNIIMKTFRATTNVTEVKG